MADTKKSTDGPEPFDQSAWDPKTLPDFDDDFIKEEDIREFEKALAVPEHSPSEEDLLSPKQPTEFITALNDWRPIHQRVRGRAGRKSKSKKPPRRGKDETREGWTYKFLKWPLLLIVTGWLLGLSIAYLLTRFYIYVYEQFVTWRGTRQRLRKKMRSQTNYHDWVKAAQELDRYLGNDKWKETDEYAYYDCKTIRRVTQQLHALRLRVESGGNTNGLAEKHAVAVDELRGLVEACVKNNFAGYENPRLYSESYYGTKNLVQAYVDEASKAVQALFDSKQLSLDDKRALSKHLVTNFGRTALCLSGGATFAYYHFGIAKGLLDADLIPSIITGTSGGALVAALLATRTNEELKKLLVPALAARITACHDSFAVWAKRWYQTGARFDSVDWARRCGWFCRGSLTFAEAYERTGRIFNVSCVPSDPHSPTILANYLTAPDCVIWSAVLASAAVPGILNPVVLMRKRKDGTLEPFSFGHKWKDGSLRTDIPLKSLNLHFNVNFSVVSQVNPHISLFFFSSRGAVGRPVTHRRGRGWRGGFLGSALEQYLKLDLTKWLKVLRHLELLPRWMGQDWSEVWLQRFSGTITIWPKTKVTDFYYILADPTPERLALMIYSGQQAAFPKLNFIGNRLKIEKVIEKARRETRVDPRALPTPSLDKERLKNMFSDEDLRELLKKAEEPPLIPKTPRGLTRNPSDETGSPTKRRIQDGEHVRSGSLSKKLSSWFGSLSGSPKIGGPDFDGAWGDAAVERRPSIKDLNSAGQQGRRGSVLGELGRQSRVFFDDSETEGETDGEGKEGARSMSGESEEGSVPMQAVEAGEEAREKL
ncbi:acyl transferase/acyl hydrolase/lysophospholipase [Elsinoe ampelina]|uniref:Patatin-like phospholipase domain-containing protein n=1 Tax=Elsinoe ampelina TaxID=302913 RepID=A0A6A6G6P0_9PEZI|nr:acyl transferase/acyl hydrolase/lysophospholipase [Elsinoe ampelina]